MCILWKWWLLCQCNTEGAISDCSTALLRLWVDWQKAMTRCEYKDGAIRQRQQAKDKSTAAQPHAQKRLWTSWLSNDQCELISIHLFVLLLESFFVPFVIDFASIFLHVCMHSLSPLMFVFFCVTSAHCNGTPNVTKISRDCITFQGSISGMISRTLQGSIPGTISRTFRNFVALFPGRSCLQCLITGSMQKNGGGRPGR